MNCNPETIPAELKARNQWVGFQLRRGKKIPCVADNSTKGASSTDCGTWRPFGVALDGLQRNKYDAIAYALNGDFIGIDLDDCTQGGKLNASSAEIVQRCASYSEISVSGAGVHILLSGVLPGGKGHNGGGVELYGQGRFLIVTGNRLDDAPADIHSNAEAVDWLLARFNGGVIEKTEMMESAECIEKFRKLDAIGSSRLPAPSSHAGAGSMCPLAIVMATLPNRAGIRHRAIFRLARGLRHEAGRVGQPVKELKGFVRGWHNLAMPHIRTKEFSETWTDFVNGFDRAKTPLAGDVLNVAWKRVTAEPDHPAAIENGYDAKPLCQIVGLCAALAGSNGRFHLAANAAAKLAAVSDMQAYRWLNTLVADGIIERAEVGDRHRSTRYRWMWQPAPRKEAATP